mgnify:CR=1 FL=1
MTCCSDHRASDPNTKASTSFVACSQCACVVVCNSRQEPDPQMTRSKLLGGRADEKLVIDRSSTTTFWGKVVFTGSRFSKVSFALPTHQNSLKSLLHPFVNIIINNIMKVANLLFLKKKNIVKKARVKLAECETYFTKKNKAPDLSRLKLVHSSSGLNLPRRSYSTK